MKNIYKGYVYTLAMTFLLALFFTSCSGDDTNDIPPADETSGLTKIQELTDGTYVISLYTKAGTFITGYNEIFLQVKNKTTGELEKNASLSWHPVMHMMTKSHSCPYGSIQKVAGKSTLYKGFIIFQMAGNDSESWELSLDGSVNGQTFQISENLSVTNSAKRKVQVFTGADNNRYVLAMVNPSAPVMGVNTMTAYLYKMQDMDTFVPVNGYTVKIDPRMPSMGNHTSPNNKEMAYTGTSGFYQGKVNFTMTGYWKISLIVLDSDNQVLKGEAVTGEEASSLFFEVEF